MKAGRRRPGVLAAALFLGMSLPLGEYPVAYGAPASPEPTVTTAPATGAATPAPAPAAAPTTTAPTVKAPATKAPATTAPTTTAPGPAASTPAVPPTSGAARAPSPALAAPPSPAVTAATTGPEAIAAKAASDADFVGSAVSAVKCGLVNDGCLQTYQSATIYWSPATGAHWARGGILNAWGRNRWEAGPLGYPVTDESCGLGRGGCRQDFENGAMFWSPASDAHWVGGAIRTKWESAGGEDSFLGYPTSDQYCGLVRSGCGAHFQGGLVYWSPSTGAHWIVGGIGGAWGRNRWETGPLGYPVSDEWCGLGKGGCRQDFENGAMFWSPASDAHWVGGAIRAKWESAGGEDSFLGYPTSDQYCGLVRSGCGAHFQGGLMYWSPKTDAHWIVGAISGEWGRNSWETGRYGYPTSDEQCRTGSGGGTLCRQSFENGTIKWRNDIGIIDCSRLKCMVLTFDDGPSQHTSRLVDLLDANNVQATFFVVGQNVVNFPATTQRSFANGNEIMNHSWDHPDLATLGPAEVASELSQTSNAIESIVGVRPKLMRPPYGSYNATVTSAAGQQGMSVILWNVETSDWSVQVTSAVIDNATSRAQPGGIVLMHDLYPTTVDAVPTIISNLKARGYALVTVSDLLGPTPPGQVYVGRL